MTACWPRSCAVCSIPNSTSADRFRRHDAGPADSPAPRRRRRPVPIRTRRRRSRPRSRCPVPVICGSSAGIGLLCGDATNAQDVARLLDGARPHLMATIRLMEWGTTPPGATRLASPPPHARGRSRMTNRADWARAWALFPWRRRLCLACRRACADGDRQPRGGRLRDPEQIIWAKPRFVLGRGDYHWQHEPCLYAVPQGATGHWQGARATRRAVVDSASAGTRMPRRSTAREASSSACAGRSSTNSAVGRCGIRALSGSGTTIIAAEPRRGAATRWRSILGTSMSRCCGGRP